MTNGGLRWRIWQRPQVDGGRGCFGGVLRKCGGCLGAARHGEAGHGGCEARRRLGRWWRAAGVTVVAVARVCGGGVVSVGFRARELVAEIRTMAVVPWKATVQRGVGRSSG
uniref:Uncharacterized protein n=1 Tax=Oryza sativa subsp. japonica TaxID=39947 RepID=Q84S86_ORYSJ|nr:hypothetical protein [Oryza sativa Japonica Group]